MATKAEYAKWCLDFINGEDYFVADLIESLREDEYINGDDEWLGDDD